MSEPDTSSSASSSSRVTHSDDASINKDCSPDGMKGSEYSNDSFEGVEPAPSIIVSIHTLDPAHPRNLGRFRKFAILIAVSLSGFLSSYSAAAHLTAFPEMSAFFKVSVASIANTIGLSLLGMSVGPLLIWNPLSITIGRRPTYLISSFLLIPCQVWLARSTTFDSFAAARFFAGLISSAGLTLPPTTIADIYPKEVRGDKVAVFATFMTIAPAVAPLVCGFVVAHLTWQWVYYNVLIMSGLQFLLFCFIVPETMYVLADSDALASGQSDGDTGDLEKMSLPPGRVGAAWMPWHRPRDYLRLLCRPLVLCTKLVLLLPALLGGIAFMWSVGLTVIAPQIFRSPPYNFSPPIIGVTYVDLIGGLLGKPLGGIVGDRVVTYVQNERGGAREPEYRYWALLPLLPFLFAGLLIFGICVQLDTHWLGVLAGGTIYFCAMVGTFGIVQTQMIESNLAESMNAVAVFNFFKCIMGFTAPFFTKRWSAATSFTSCYVIQGVITLVFGLVIALILLRWGKQLRLAQGMPVL